MYRVCCEAMRDVSESFRTSSRARAFYRRYFLVIGEEVSKALLIVSATMDEIETIPAHVSRQVP